MQDKNQEPKTIIYGDNVSCEGISSLYDNTSSFSNVTNFSFEELQPSSVSGGTTNIPLPNGNFNDLSTIPIAHSVITMRVGIKIKMKEGCEDLFPYKAHSNDSGYDLFSREDITIPSGETRLIETGVFMEMPSMYEAQIRPRSGLALKHGITFLNSPGTIDSGYRGEVGVIMYNTGKETFEVYRGSKIAQMVICKLPEVILESVDVLSDSSRGSLGFGSSGNMVK